MFTKNKSKSFVIIYFFCIRPVSVKNFDVLLYNLTWLSASAMALEAKRTPIHFYAHTSIIIIKIISEWPINVLTTALFSRINAEIQNCPIDHSEVHKHRNFVANSPILFKTTPTSTCWSKRVEIYVGLFI